MNYLGIVFCATTWHNVYMFISSTHYFIFIALVVMLAISRTMNLVGYAKKVEAKIAAKQKTT